MFLYLTTDGLTITKLWWRFIIKNPDAKEESEQQLPISLIEGMVIFGRIQLSTDCIKACLQGKIPVFFLSKIGNYFWKLESLEVKNIALLYTHIKASMNPEICLSYARVIVSSKLSNSKVMLQRRKRFYKVDANIEKVCTQLDEMLYRARDCSSLEQLRGFEGIAARYYFECFSYFIPSPFTFNGRNRRPPKDPVNSMLSLWYTLLAQTIQMILSIQWIEPQIWFFHQPKDLKTLLVLDMMEMYRARIVDDLIIRLLYRKKMQISHFICDEKNEERPVFLSDEGIKIFLSEYYKVIFKERGSAEIPYENDFLKLKIIEKNLEVFKQSLVKETFDYEGFKIK